MLDVDIKASTLMARMLLSAHVPGRWTMKAFPTNIVGTSASAASRATSLPTHTRFSVVVLLCRMSKHCRITCMAEREAKGSRFG